MRERSMACRWASANVNGDCAKALAIDTKVIASVADIRLVISGARCGSAPRQDFMEISK
jgi:hypothetical protein